MHDTFSRRSFLKAGALTAAGLWAAPQLPAQAAPGPQPLRGTLRPTRWGQVQGGQAAHGALVWYGVPYAAAPVGLLRWQPPQDPASWTGPLDCTAPAPLALQPCNGMPVGVEDCLRLDIYAPDGAAQLPVVVYFHGGGNRTGSTREMSGAKLAARAGCVFVSVGYRLGLLGFNCLPALQNGPDRTGNYALLDAAKAFDWVRDNIAAFGGDPGNVTAMGFSAGGRDVLAMLASPCFAGRFHKAVSLSGGLSAADPQASARQIARALAPLAVEDGLCPDPETAFGWLLEDREEVRRWLYDLDPARICMQMPDGGDLRMSSFPHLYADGVTLPRDGFARGACNAVPLLLATASTEFSLFNPFPDFYQAQGLMAGEAAAARQWAVGYGSELYQLYNGPAAARTLTDGGYAAPIWLCRIAYGAPDSRSPIHALGLGSYHGICLPMLSDENDLAGLAGLSSAGFAAMSDAFLQAVGAFLRTGTPRADALPAWQPWTADRPEALVLDADDRTLDACIRPAPAGCDGILNAMEADGALSPHAKEVTVRTVLNGRLFSAALDARWHNPSLWT